MNAYDAALAILNDGPLTRTSIENAVRAALLVADPDLPTSHDRIAVKFDTRSKTTLGQCEMRKSDGMPIAIIVSLPCAALAPGEELADTIAHEVAHAAAGFEAAHGPEWLAIARRYGATVSACSADSRTLRAHKYAYYCGTCERVIGRQAGRPRKRRLCQHCRNRVATIDLSEGTVLPGHSITITHRSKYRAVISAQIDDYHEAWDAILTLQKSN